MFSAPIIKTPPTGELITIESARSYLRIDGEDLDLEVQMLAAAAVQDVEETTGLLLLDQEVEVTAECFEDLAQLRTGPVSQIVSIEYRDQAEQEQTLDAASYELVGAVFEQAIRPVGRVPTAKRGSIRIRMKVGYATPAEVPAKLRFAAFALLRGRFEDQDVDISPLIVNLRFW